LPSANGPWQSTHPELRQVSNPALILASSCATAPVACNSQAAAPSHAAARRPIRFGDIAREAKVVPSIARSKYTASSAWMEAI
jgi:hypothetical protein